MELVNSIQVSFFQNLKAKIPDYASMVDEVAEVLDISLDSAYRRIRGEKLMNLEEIALLSHKFNFSVDQVLSVSSNTVLFQANQNSFDDDTNFNQWMLDVLAQLEMVASFTKKHIYFLLKDIPPWYHFYHKELAEFKFFFWQKSILFNEKLKDQKFSVETPRYPEMENLTQKILKTYNKIPTTEIWNLEGINTTIRQIELYHQMGLMGGSNDAICLYQCLVEVIDHLEKMAELGKKFLPGQLPNEESPAYNFFVNEFILGDNTFFVTLNETKITYLNYSVIYFMGTTDQKFNEGMFRNLQNLIKKSTPISQIGEKERRQFFKQLKWKVLSKIEGIKNSY